MVLSLTSERPSALLGYLHIFAWAGVGLALNNGQAVVPQMGWDTYNAYGLAYNETDITNNAKLLTSLGFRDLGYNVVIFDDAMTEYDRAANGSLVENAEKFPSGLKSIADGLHTDGLRFGVYSSAGLYTCGGYPGALGYEAMDAQWWASLGADYLKYDNCYNEGQSGTPQISERRYANMSNALNATGRPFLYSLCNWGDDKPWEWASTIANSARISGDIIDSFSRPSTLCPCGPDTFYCELPGVTCSVVNILGKGSHYVTKNEPGYWNDLDMLQVGNGGMSYDEYKVHFSMWALIKSPLIMGTKLYELTPADYGILINPAVLAISQDPASTPIVRQLVETTGVAVDRYGMGDLQLWSGLLSNGDRMVAFINTGNTSTLMSYSLMDVFGVFSTPADSMFSWDLYDLWGNETVIPEASAAMVLNNTVSIAEVDGGKWYYNSSQSDSGNGWVDGLAKNVSLLFGTPAGMLAAGANLEATVPRHGIALWRLRPVSPAMRKRDEL